MSAMGDEEARAEGATDNESARRSSVAMCRRGHIAALLALFTALVGVAAYLGTRRGDARDPTLGDSAGEAMGDASSLMTVNQQKVLRQPPPPSSTTPARCPDGEHRWVLRLLTDDFPGEIRWELHASDGDQGEDAPLASGPPEGTKYKRRTRYVGALCLPPGEYFMRWFDSLGDGMCCAYGQGEWSARVEGGVVLESDPEDLYEEKDFPFEVERSEVIDDVGDSGEEITGTILIRARGERPLNVELPEGTVYEMQNLPPRFVDYAKRELVSGVSLISLPESTEFFPNGTADLKGEAPIASGQREKEGTAFEGTQSVLVVRVDVADKAMSVNETSLSNSVFGNGVDRANMVSQFDACSHGKLKLVKAPDRSGGSADNRNASIANGVATVKLPSVRKVDGQGTMRIAVTKELNRMFDVKHPTELAKFVVYCLPVGTYSPNPGGIAFAYIHHWLSIFNDKWCTSVSLQMHELGHNLNMGHSNEGGETYEDQTGIMGASYPNSDSPRMCFNAAKSWQTGWYRDKGITINSNGADNSFDGILHGIADYPIATTVLLRIQNRSGNDHFVNFNAKRGINAQTQEARNMVTVVRRPRGGRNSYAESELVAKLDSGESFEIRGYIIRVGRIDAVEGTAEVTVSPT